MPLSRREFLSIATAATIGTAANSRAQATRPPNIIFIIVDDMGYADLSCYGSTAIETPNIDRMAADGIRFTNAYSGCTVCAPARSTLMTGLHMGHTSVRGNTGGIALQTKDVTIAEVLREAGYATGGFGKWGLGDIGTDGAAEKQGFDVFYGYYHQIHAHNYYPPYIIRNGDKEPLRNEEGDRKGGGEDYTHYNVMHEMKRFIREHRDEPFFCYAPWTPPHGDYVIPDDDPGMVKYADKPWSQRAKVVAAMTDMIDRNVGDVLNLLDELDIADNTAVFFCSDNGAAHRFEGELDSSGPLRGMKRDMYEGGIRVPMIARWPGTIKPGQTSDLPTYFPDMFPTFADIANAEYENEVDGLSILPTLTGKGKQKKHEALYWEWPTYDWKTRSYPPNGLMQAVRMGKWKMLRQTSDADWELYDLSKDIGETNNLAAENLKQVEKMTEWIAANRTEPRVQLEPEMPEGQKYR